MRNAIAVIILLVITSSLVWAQAQPGEPVRVSDQEVGQAGTPAPAGEVANATPPPPPAPTPVPAVAAPPQVVAPTPASTSAPKPEPKYTTRDDIEGLPARVEALEDRCGTPEARVLVKVINNYVGGRSHTHRAHRAAAAPTPRPEKQHTNIWDTFTWLRSLIDGLGVKIKALTERLTWIEGRVATLEKAQSITPSPPPGSHTPEQPGQTTPTPQTPQPPAQGEVAPGPQSPAPTPAPGPAPAQSGAEQPDGQTAPALQPNMLDYVKDADFKRYKDDVVQTFKLRDDWMNNQLFPWLLKEHGLNQTRDAAITANHDVIQRHSKWLLIVSIVAALALLLCVVHVGGYYLVQHGGTPAEPPAEGE